MRHFCLAKAGSLRTTKPRKSGSPWRSSDKALLPPGTLGSYPRASFSHLPASKARAKTSASVKNHTFSLSITKFSAPLVTGPPTVQSLFTQSQKPNAGCRDTQHRARATKCACKRSSTEPGAPKPGQCHSGAGKCGCASRLCSEALNLAKPKREASEAVGLISRLKARSGHRSRARSRVLRHRRGFLQKSIPTLRRGQDHICSKDACYGVCTAEWKGSRDHQEQRHLAKEAKAKKSLIRSVPAATTTRYCHQPLYRNIPPLGCPTSLKPK